MAVRTILRHKQPQGMRKRDGAKKMRIKKKKTTSLVERTERVVSPSLARPSPRLFGRNRTKKEANK